MIPFSTDAPLYHKPFATCALIAVNILMFMLFCRHHESANGPFIFVDEKGNHLTLEEIKASDPESAAEIEKVMKQQSNSDGRSPVNMLSVEFGRVRPWQWLTTNFMHADFEHLLGNMIFLWAFGLVVEGKVGHLAFLGIYLGIGILYGMMIQLGSLYFANQGIALGASAAIFGLLALCVIWAPANEFTVFTGRRIIDLPIIMFGGFFIGKELLFLYLQQFCMSSELLHAIGFFIGFPLGAVMVKNNWVDCEGWDLFTYTGMGGSSKKKGKKRTASPGALRTSTANSYEDQPYFREMKQEASRKTPAAKKLDQIAKMIEAGQYDEAIDSFEQAENEILGLEWRQPDLYKLIQGLLTARQFKKALPLVEYHANNFEEQKPEMQLVLIRLFLALNNSESAKRIMGQVNLAELNEKQRELLHKIEQKIKLNG